MTKKMRKRELLERKGTKADKAAQYERVQIQVFADLGILWEYEGPNI